MCNDVEQMILKEKSDKRKKVANPILISLSVILTISVLVVFYYIIYSK